MILLVLQLCLQALVLVWVPVPHAPHRLQALPGQQPSSLQRLSLLVPHPACALLRALAGAVQCSPPTSAASALLHKVLLRLLVLETVAAAEVVVLAVRPHHHSDRLAQFRVINRQQHRSVQTRMTGFSLTVWANSTRLDATDTSQTKRYGQPT